LFVKITELGSANVRDRTCSARMSVSVTQMVHAGWAGISTMRGMRQYASTEKGRKAR
jgi:hypothetical protein